MIGKFINSIKGWDWDDWKFFAFMSAIYVMCVMFVVGVSVLVVITVKKEYWAKQAAVYYPIAQTKVDCAHYSATVLVLKSSTTNDMILIDKNSGYRVPEKPIRGCPYKILDEFPTYSRSKYDVFMENLTPFQKQYAIRGN